MSVCVSHAPGMARDPEARQGLTFRAGLARVRGLVANFDPELVVMFGADHVRAYQPVVPAVSLVLEATGLGDAGSPRGKYDVPREEAAALAEHLLASDIDCAVTHSAGLDHGFGQTAADVLGGLDAKPLVPVHINCAEAPMISCARAVSIGEVVGGYFGADPRRILFLASGGLSHAPPALESGVRGMDEAERRRVNLEGSAAAAGRINEDWDRAFLKRLDGVDRGWVAALGETLEQQAGCGAHEVRTWLAAWAAGGLALHPVTYEAVPAWITGMGVVSSTDLVAQSCG
jgi:2,3-dihydroxyphenylpropionate 1,2-dioxygenase